MRINTKPRKQNSRRADLARRCPAHLQWLRGRICCTSAEDCSGKIEAAHVDRAGGKGTGLKVADWHAVPLCARHHQEYHRGAATFEARRRIDLVAAAKAFASQSPHRAKFADAQRDEVAA